MVNGNEQEDWKMQSRRFSGMGFAVVCFMIICSVTAGTVDRILMMVSKGMGIPFDSFYGISMLGTEASQFLIALPVTAAILHLIPKCGAPQRERWSIGKFAACLVIAVGIGGAGSYVGEMVEQLKPWGVGMEIATNTLVWPGIGVEVLVGVIIGPVMEELLFRKLLMDRLLGFGELPAILFSALVFGLFHGNFAQFFAAFSLGLLFGFIYARTGKIGYTIAIHMIFNFRSVIMAEFLKGAGMLSDNGGYWKGVGHLSAGLSPALCKMVVTGFEVLQVVCLIGGIVILILQCRKLHFLSGSWPLQKGRRFQTMILNGGMILFLCIYIYIFIIF